jgi:hypothetical protein
MPNETSIQSLDDIEFDRRGSEAFAQYSPAFDEVPAGPARFRDIYVSGEVRRDSGNRLLAGCLDDTRRKFATLLQFERSIPSDGDYALLIAAISQVLESECDRLVTTPARRIAGLLVESLRADRKLAKQSEIVEKWAGGEVPTTIGIESLAILALRKGSEQGREGVIAFLAEEFRTPYHGLLMTKKLGQCLDLIRDRYRNPACHGTGSFDASGFAGFARLAVGHDGFRAWAAEGPKGRPVDAGSAFLHHHLAHSRRIGPGTEEDRAGTALDRLLGLAKGPESPLSLHLRPHRADQSSTFRSITVTPTRLELPFRPGDRIRFGFQSAVDCHVALIDVGTSGAVSVVLPNNWCHSSRVRGGEPHFVPGRDFSEFEFTVGGDVGVERVLAVASLRPLPAAPLLPEPGQPFRTLDGPEIDRLVAALERLEPGTWAVKSCEFTIEGGAG